MSNPLRVIWQRSRSIPAARGLVGAVDRAWWARRIRSADIVDLDFAAVQLGRNVSTNEAIRAYVGGGWKRGMSLNPLLCEQTVMRVLSDDERVPALYAYLVNDRRDVEVSPNWDAPAYARRVPEALDDPAGPLGHAWRSARAGQPLLLGRGDRERAVSWTVISELAGTAAGVSAHGGQVAFGPSDPEPTSQDPDAVVVVCVLAADERDPGRALADAADLTAAPGAELHVEVDGPSATVWAQAALLSAWASNARVELAATRDAGHVAAPRIARTAGTLLMRGPHAEISRADLEALLEAGRERPTAPLWLRSDGAIAAAGVVIRAGRRIHLLAGQPAEDARALGEQVEVAELAGTTFAGPLDPAVSDAARTLVGLTVIAPDLAPAAAFADLPDTDIDSLIEPAGITITDWRGDRPRYSRAASFVELADGTRVPSLRWAIKTSAPVGRAGESWGDTHFARGLARALRRLGQDVVVDARPASGRESTYLDDVSLVLRGPHRIDPPPTGQSLLWVISHPDEITADEVGSFGRVFAASETWAAKASERWDAEIAPLLQCTDAGLFRPSGLPRGDTPVFVGTARGIERPSVVEPIRAGIPVAVYGPDWRAFIAASSIVATGVPHSELPALYESASVVLNDHWPAMQAEGFIANRPFDAVAAGGRVISDHVDGIERLFGGAVQTYRSIPELLTMLAGDLDSIFPADDELARIGTLVRERDSFDARARTLLDAALHLT